MNNSNPDNKITLEDNSINLRTEIFKYLIYWKWFVLSLVLSFITVKLYLRYSIPIYKASTRILIKGEESGGLSSELSVFKDLGFGGGSKNNLDDETEILKSRIIVGRTILAGKFNISYIEEGTIKSSERYEDNPIEINFDTQQKDFYKKDTTFTVEVLSANAFTLYNEEKSKVGEYIFGQKILSKKLGAFNVNLTGKNEKPFKGRILVTLRPLDQVIDQFKGSLGITTLAKYANVLEISYSDPVKEKAEDFLDGLVEIYNSDAIADKKIISEKTALFINERLKIITSELSGVEKDVEKYKLQNSITDLPTEAELYLKNSSEFKKEEIATEIQSKVVDIMVDFMKKNTGFELIPSNIIPNDNTAATFIAEYNNLVIERNRILKSSTPDNPIVVRVTEKINELKGSIYESLKKAKASLSIQNKDISNQVGLLGGRISKMPRQEREYREIFRQQQIKEELYLYLFKKREETAISLAATAPFSKIVDLAYSSGVPVSPKRNVLYLASFFIGIMIPFGIIYSIYLLDTKVKNRHDVEANLHAPFIGDVPHSDANNEIMQPASRSSTAEAIRIVRTNLEFILNNVQENRAKTIFLTSTLPKEGKTFIAVNLAATIAISGKKILLIGMDIRNPKLDEYVKLPSKGLTNFISSNDADIKSFIVKQKGYEHFDILPAGIIPPNPAELLMSKKVEAMFDGLKKEYDYIVVDTAPVSLVTDTLLISKNADAFVYVVRSNYLEKAMLKIPETFYKEQKLPNMCVLLNDTNSINGYGYGYGHEVVKKPWYKRIFSLARFS